MNKIYCVQKKKKLNRNQIKYLIIIAMIIDHIALKFIDYSQPIIGGFMHLIGRLVCPTMAYFIAEGYYYTRNLNKYLLRLGLFGFISWFAFVYYLTGHLPVYIDNQNIKIDYRQGVIFTFFLGIVAIRIWDNVRISKKLKKNILLYSVLYLP